MSRLGLNRGITFRRGWFDTVTAAPRLMAGAVNFREESFFLFFPFVTFGKYAPAVGCFFTKSSNLFISATDRYR